MELLALNIVKDSVIQSNEINTHFNTRCTHRTSTTHELPCEPILGKRHRTAASLQRSLRCHKVQLERGDLLTKCEQMLEQKELPIKRRLLLSNERRSVLELRRAR